MLFTNIFRFPEIIVTDFMKQILLKQLTTTYDDLFKYQKIMRKNYKPKFVGQSSKKLSNLVR